MTQGRTPAAAISTIFKRIWFGKGRPFINTPPNWFTLPWPAKKVCQSLGFLRRQQKFEKISQFFNSLDQRKNGQFCQIFVTCLENINFKSSWHILFLDFTNLLKLTTFFIYNFTAILWKKSSIWVSQWDINKDWIIMIFYFWQG